MFLSRYRRQSSGVGKAFKGFFELFPASFFHKEQVPDHIAKNYEKLNRPFENPKGRFKKTIVLGDSLSRS
ncbi:MAG: hypothetical protein COB46_05810 [Rhodospirillaceae bacterium]|nr:MAG: hypothetical protein COB46_05810 [Rhodospirillaceae bacterium]